MAFSDNSAFLNRISALSSTLNQALNINLLAKFIQDKRDIQLLGTTESVIVERFNGMEFVSAANLHNDLHQDFLKNNHFAHYTNNIPTPYLDEFVVDFLSPNTSIEASTWLGQNLELNWRSSGLSAQRQQRYLKVQSLSHLYHDGGIGHYRLRLVVPWFRLSQRINSRIFADQDSVEIAKTILTEHEIAITLQVQQALSPRRRCTQYQESDWLFILRILAEDGISVLAKHAAGSASIVLADMAGLQQYAQQHDLGTISYGVISAALPDDRLSHLVIKQHNIPAQVQRGAWSSHDVDGKNALSAAVDNPVINDYLQRISHACIDDDGVQVAAGDQGFAGDPVLDKLANLLQQHHGLHATEIITLGGVRDFQPMAAFTLLDHPTHSGKAFQLLSVRHEAANSSGYLAAIDHAATAVQALIDPATRQHLIKQQEDLINHVQAGSYRAWATLANAALPVVPKPQPRPNIPLLSAVVHNLAGQDNALPDSDRDHRVHVLIPLLTDDSGSHPALDQWVPVSEYQSGPNFGSLFSPTPDDEVLLGNLGHADAPLVMGGLANSRHTLPFAPQDNQQLSSGYIAKGNSADKLQWVFHDDPKQPFQQLQVNSAAKEAGSILSSLTLGQINPQGLQGLELVTSHQGMVRSGQGLWVSTLPATEKDDRQHEARPLHEQLQGSMQQAQSMIDLTANLAELATTTEGVKQLTETLKPLADQAGQASGNSSSTASLDGIPTHLEQPHLILESAADTIMTAGEGVLLQSGEDTELWAMADITTVANQSIQAAAVETMAILANKNVSAIAGSGELRLAAHAGAMQLLASKDVNISSSESSIKITAKDKVVITAGGATIELNGSNITISANKFTVKAGQSHYGAAAGGGAELAALPNVTDEPHLLELNYAYEDLSPVKLAPYTVRFADGTIRKGILDDKGYAKIDNVPSGKATVEYGEDGRPAPEDFIKPLQNPILGQKPRTDAEAEALLQQFAASQQAYLEDHLFDDEIEDLADGDPLAHEDYEDYILPDEDDAEKTDGYRIIHPNPPQNPTEAEDE